MKGVKVLKKIISLTLILLLIITALPTVPTFADEIPEGYKTSIDAFFDLNLKPNDLRGLKDVLKDFYLYKGSNGDLEKTLTEDAKAALIEAGLEDTIGELRDANRQIQEILVANGLTKSKTKSIVISVINAFEAADSLTDMVGVLQDLKSEYAEIIVNIKNNITTEDIPFMETEDLEYTVPTYFYYLGKLAQDKKMVVYDENNPEELTIDIASRYSNDTIVQTQIPDGADGLQKSFLNDYLMISLMNGQISEANFSVNSLKGPLETSLQSQIDGYLDWEDANYSASEIAYYLEALGILERVPLDDDEEDDDDDDDDNNNGGNTGGNTGGGGGGGGGFVPATPQNGPQAVSDNLITGENMPVDVTIDELLENDVDAETFVGLGSSNNGTAEINGDIITFTPRNNFTGRGIFRYIIADAEGIEDTGLVLVDISDEIVIIDDEITPLGNGGPNQLSVIEQPDNEEAIVSFEGAYLEGYPDGTFRPNAPVTRAEIVSILVRVLGIDITDPGEPLFSDIKSEDWYYEEVQGLAKEGLINGYPDGTFAPNKTVTHGEIATILSNYWRKKNIFISMEDSGYTDIDGHWAKYHIRRMFNAGVSVRFGDGSFKPDQDTTRSEAAIIINQFIGRPTAMELTNKYSDVDDTIWGAGAIEAASEPIE